MVINAVPDVLVSVHVHGVELLHLFLACFLLHVLQHLVCYVLGEDGQQQPFLWRATDVGQFDDRRMLTQGSVS